jgi:hypothetical protein
MADAIRRELTAAMADAIRGGFCICIESKSRYISIHANPQNLWYVLALK